MSTRADASVDELCAIAKCLTVLLFVCLLNRAEIAKNQQDTLLFT